MNTDLPDYVNQNIRITKDELVKAIARANSYIEDNKSNILPDILLNELEQTILHSKNAECALWCAENIGNCNRQAMSELVLKYGDILYIKYFYILIDFDKSKYDLMLLFE